VAGYSGRLVVVGRRWRPCGDGLWWWTGTVEIEGFSHQVMVATAIRGC